MLGRPGVLDERGEVVAGELPFEGAHDLLMVPLEGEVRTLRFYTGSVSGETSRACF